MSIPRRPIPVRTTRLLVLAASAVCRLDVELVASVAFRHGQGLRLPSTAPVATTAVGRLGATAPRNLPGDPDRHRDRSPQSKRLTRRRPDVDEARARHRLGCCTCVHGHAWRGLIGSGIDNGSWSVSCHRQHDAGHRGYHHDLHVVIEGRLGHGDVDVVASCCANVTQTPGPCRDAAGRSSLIAGPAMTP